MTIRQDIDHFLTELHKAVLAAPYAPIDCNETVKNIALEFYTVAHKAGVEECRRTVVNNIEKVIHNL